MKERIDILLVQEGFYENVDKAKRAVMAGLVIVNDMRVDKPGTKYERGVTIRIKGEQIPYVSRGGLKLEKALNEFGMNLAGKKVLDIGASTGGFTDCALQHGAQFVYAVDVGTNQLDWGLRNNPRVKSIENTHIKDLKLEDIDNEYVQCVVIDVSFISLWSVLYDAIRFLDTKGEIIALIKPQFEADKDKIEKGGIVKNFDEHKRIIEKIALRSSELGIGIKHVIPSPIKGTHGNVEYLAHLSYGEGVKLEDIEKAVDAAEKLN